MSHASSILSILRQPRQRLWMYCVGLFVAAEGVDRVVLFALAARHEVAVSPSALLVFPLGLLNDAAIGVVLGLPFLIGLHAFARFWRTRPGAIVGHLLLYALLCLLVFDEIADVVFWREFDSRFNSIAVNYLIFPREVIGTVNESFSGWLVGSVPIAAAVLYALLRTPLRAALTEPRRSAEWQYALAAIGLSATAAVALLIGGPLAAGGGRVMADLSADGTERLVAAALTNDQAYDGLYIGMDDARAVALVRAQVAQDNTAFVDPADPRSLVRHVAPDQPARPLNVVFVIEESFGSSYVNSTDAGDGPETSPHLDALAREGLFFTNIYATGNRTVNALEALLTSFPPLPGISTARRPGSRGMNSLPAVLRAQGYRTAFLYGGRKVFDNMGSFWSGIGYENVWDQADVQDPGFTTIWGVADEDLFTEALRRMDALTADATAPALLTMLTVSNHRPYLYPAGRIDRPPEEKRRHNAAKYADWAFGDFINRARAKPWFKETVFIFIGDHGPRVFGAAVVPVQSYRVPLLFYSPAHITPRRSDVLGSSIDVAPTLLGLLGLPYDNPFFGVDLRHVQEGGGRVVMQHNFAIALGDGADAVAIAPGKRLYGYTMRPGPFELTRVETPVPALTDNLIALIQTAHRMFYAHQYHRAPATPPTATATPGS